MNATFFDSPQGTVVEQIHDKVADLAVSVAVLANQHGHLLEAVNRIEMAVRSQAESSEEYRAALLSKVADVTTMVKATEREVEKVKTDLEKLSQRGMINWIRRNYMLITAAIAVATALLYVVRWLMGHLRF